MKKIYCILGNLPFLTNERGDKINEINTYRVLSKHFDVYYNNRLFNFDDKNFFGTNPNDKIQLPNKKYDLYYVRNNQNIFMSLPNPKLYFAVPYHINCFSIADGLVFPTDAWVNAMNDLSLGLDTIYDKPIYNKNMIVFNQITDIQDLKNHRETQKIRNNFNKKFIVGHFGRVVKSNEPSKTIVNTKDVEVIYVGLKDKIENVTCIPHIPKEMVKYYIAACDLLLYNQDYQGEFAGSLKVMDSLSYGVPIVTPKYKARVDELGIDYPFYFNKNEVGVEQLIEILNKSSNIGSYLFERAKYYNLTNSANRYYEQLNKI